MQQVLAEAVLAEAVRLVHSVRKQAAEECADGQAPVHAGRGGGGG